MKIFSCQAFKNSFTWGAKKQGLARPYLRAKKYAPKSGLEAFIREMRKIILSAARLGIDGLRWAPCLLKLDKKRRVGLIYFCEEAVTKVPGDQLPFPFGKVPQASRIYVFDLYR